MFLKILNFSRDSPRTRYDLQKRLEYIFLPKVEKESSEQNVNFSKPIKKERLAGPPQVYNLTLTTRPWGDTAIDAAEDLSHQMLRYAQNACMGTPFPKIWFTHILISFHRFDGPKLSNPNWQRAAKTRYRSKTKNAMFVCVDLLKAVGMTFTQPVVLACHSDVTHLHVHALVILPVNNDVEKIIGDFPVYPWHKGAGGSKSTDGQDVDTNQSSSSYLLNYQRSDLRDLALISTNVFGLTPPSLHAITRTKERQSIKRLLEDLNALDERKTN